MFNATANKNAFVSSLTLFVVTKSMFLKAKQETLNLRTHLQMHEGSFKFKSNHVHPCSRIHCLIRENKVYYASAEFPNYSF